MILEKETLEKFGYLSANLGKGSAKLCLYSCDYCNRITEKEYYRILRGRKGVVIDVCDLQECKNKKYSEVYQKNTSKNIENINNKRKKTCLEKFGVDNAAKLKEKQTKAEETRFERYGVRHALQSKKIQQKRNATLLKEYGTLSTIDASGRKEEIVAQLKEKALETVRKGKETCLKRYGVDNAQKCKEINKKRLNTTYKRFGLNHFSNISKINIESRRMHFSKILEICDNKKYKPLFTEEEYQGKKYLLKFLCLVHNKEFISKISYILSDFNQCPSCRNYNSSKQEKEILEFVKTFYDGTIIEHERKIVKTELDIYIPEKNFAIEYHGLYWHSILNKNLNYHKDKFLKCQEKGIKLFQFYEDEWRDKQNICKSMIVNALGRSSQKLSARNLVVSETKTLKDCNIFLNQNHLMGSYDGVSAKTFCLVDEQNNIICCLLARSLFSKEKQNKNLLEIVRFGTQLNVNVRGGFSKLLKACKDWAATNKYTKIITYSDSRYSNGNVYKQNNFNFVSQTKPNYYYTDFINRYPKYQFRTTKKQTEKQIVEGLGLYKIYNAGNYRWELKL